jgi:lipid-A-disaccharide synthase
MKYYLIAGEASGDLHGSNLIKALKKLDPIAEMRCWGGEKMQDEGAELIKHYRDLAFMGFAEVVKNLPTIFKNINFCKKDISSFNPDVVILIDYPGFNLRIAKWAKEKGYKVVYYISPQIWAWKENRVHAIKKYVDKMLVILPFEKDFYAKWNYEVDYVGHPLVEVIDEFMEAEKGKPNTIAQINKGIIALLPGSRKQEILKKLPVMIQVSKHFPDYSFVVAKAPGVEDEFYGDMLKDFENVYAVTGKTYSILYIAKAALVTSGTATLETALFALPEIVCYKGSAISYQIAKRLIKIKFISLVNLIMNKEVVKELIQGEMNTKNLVAELNPLLTDNEKKFTLQQDYAELKKLLSAGGHASSNAAKIIYTFIKN